MRWLGLSKPVTSLLRYPIEEEVLPRCLMVVVPYEALRQPSSFDYRLSQRCKEPSGWAASCVKTQEITINYLGLTNTNLDY